MAIAVRPFTCLDINARTDETERRTTLVGFDQSQFCLVIENRLSGQFAECTKFKKQGAGFSRVRHRIADLAGAKINIDVGQSRR